MRSTVLPANSWIRRHMPTGILRWLMWAWWPDIMSSQGSITSENPEHWLFVVVVVLVLTMNIMSTMYILWGGIYVTPRLMNLCCITSSCSWTCGAKLWSSTRTMLALLIMCYKVSIVSFAIASNILWTFSINLVSSPKRIRGYCI